MSNVYGGVLEGLMFREVTVETNISSGTPNIIIVGLADKAVSESKERIRCCLNLLKFNIRKITVSLSPADIKKSGAALDLSIIVGILSKNLYINFEKFIWFGEIGLDGFIKKSAGILITCLEAHKRNKIVICSKQNEDDLKILQYKNYILIENIAEVLTEDFAVKCKEFEEKILEQDKSLLPKIYNFLDFQESDELNNFLLKYDLNLLFNWLNREFDPFDHIIGQDIGKLIICLSAIGSHHCLFIGAQGVGKSLLCKSIKDILPPLSYEEFIETQAIYNLNNLDENFSNEYLNRPFRSPHSSSSLVALIGGTNSPGEISLCHNGVLFLDELPEYNNLAIESLKVPLEEGKVHISRANIKVIHPAKITLLASMNPCKCGLYFKKGCKCNKKNYIQKISAPILDRIDLSIILDNANYDSKITYFNIHRKIFNGFLRKKFTKPEISQDLYKKIQEVIINKNLSVRSLNKIINLMHTLACFENQLITISHFYTILTLKFNN